MNFLFSKEFIDKGSPNDPDKQLWLYKVLDDKNQLLGQLFYYPKKQYIIIGEREISIETVAKIFKRKYTLVDRNDNKQVGEYEIFGGRGINLFWQDVPSEPTGTIKLDNTVFNFRRVKPDIPYETLKKEPRIYFRFRLYATRGEEFYEYALKMDEPAMNKSKYRPFNGTIESNADNVLAILAGLYLMEVEFDYEDKEN